MSVEDPAVATTSPLPPEDPEKEDFIWTAATHNYVSRAADFQGSQQIELRGRSIVQGKVVIRGDLAWVRVGRYTHVRAGSKVQPPPLPMTKQQEQQYAPVTIGAHTWIGENVYSEAAAIGSSCWIGNGVRLGPRVLLKDGCVVETGVSIPADTVVPPFTRVSSVDGRLEWKELPPSITVELQERSRQFYHEFAAAHPGRTR
jgi:dynactin-5